MREEVCGEAVVSVKYDLAARCASAGCPAWAGGRGAQEKREKRDEERTLRVSPSASTHDSDIRYHHFEIKDGRHAPPHISMQH